MTDRDRQHVQVFARAAVPPSAVWPWLADASTWSTWSNLTTAELEQAGDEERDGVGAIRRLGVGPGVSREQIVVYDPPHHLAYTLLSGMPVDGYRADVHLRPDGDGTLIEWRSSFTPRWPGTGALVRVFFTRVLSGFARGLARHASASVQRVDDDGTTANGPRE